MHSIKNKREKHWVQPGFRSPKQIHFSARMPFNGMNKKNITLSILHVCHSDFYRVRCLPIDFPSFVQQNSEFNWLQSREWMNLPFDKVIFRQRVLGICQFGLPKQKKVATNWRHTFLFLLLFRVKKALCQFCPDICINLKSFTINVLLFETNELILSIGNREMYFFTVNDWLFLSNRLSALNRNYWQDELSHGSWYVYQFACRI